MKNTEKNIRSTFSSVTNIDVTSFAYAKKVDSEWKTFDVKAQLDIDAKSLTPLFFDFNVKSGKVTYKTLSFESLKGIENAAAFAHDVRAYYYAYIHADAIEKRAKYEKDNTKSDFAEQYNCVIARLDYIDNACKSIWSLGVIDAAKNVARVLARQDLKSFDDSVKTAFKAVIAELEKLYTESAEQLPNVKNLRNCITMLNNALFPVDDVGIVKRVNRRCTDALARDVYARYYKGRQLNAAGKVISTMASDKDIMAEIMLACIEAMQQHSIDIVADKKPKVIKVTEG